MLAGALMLAFLQPRKIAKAQREVLRDAFAVASRVGAHHQIFPHRQEREHLTAFGHVADTHAHDLVRGHMSDVLALEHHFATLGIENARHRTQHRGFTGAIRTQYRDDLVWRDPQRDSADGLDRTVERFDRVDVKQRLDHASTSASPPM